MLDDFIVRAIIAGFGLSLATGPLGSFVVWRRMAYFGDAMAHAAILGVAMALAFSVSITVGALVVAVVIGTTVSVLTGRGHAISTTLGVMAHSALALGLVAMSFVRGRPVNLEAFLFGDILTITWAEAVWVWIGASAVLFILIWRWSALLTSTLSEDLAAASKIDPGRERIILTLSIAVVVAVALKLVGALLIAAMLIVPAAAARGFARSPETMAVIATLFGMLATLAGVLMSLQFDTPTGPSIVVMAGTLYVVSLLYERLRA